MNNNTIGMGMDAAYSLRDYFKYMSAKEYFEFMVYCSERDDEFLDNLETAFYYGTENCYDYDHMKDSELIEIHDKYISFLKDYMVEKGIVYDMDKDPIRNHLEGHLAVGIVACDNESLLSYLLKQYDIDIPRWDIRNSIDYVADEDGWCRGVLKTISGEFEKTFLKEWNDLKLNSNNENVELKDSFHNTRRELYGDWKKEYLKYQTREELETYYLTYDYYDHNGLLINKEFVDSNTSIDKDNLMNWCEYVANKTFKNLGLKHNKEKINEFEQAAEQEMEQEYEMGR